MVRCWEVGRSAARKDERIVEVTFGVGSCE